MALTQREFKVHTKRFGGPLEFAGLSILKTWMTHHGGAEEVVDVHSDREWFDKGIDLVVRRSGTERKIDVKVDSYYGTEEKLEKKGWYHLDSGALLIETISQLQYDRDNLGKRPDQPGWFFTTTADEIYQYYLAVRGPYEELRRLFREASSRAKRGGDLRGIEAEIIEKIDAERDFLLTYSVAEARHWWESVPDDVKGEFVGALNPGYVTVSRRVDRQAFISSGPGKVVGPILPMVRNTAGDPAGASEALRQTRLDSPK